MSEEDMPILCIPLAEFKEAVKGICEAKENGNIRAAIVMHPNPDPDAIGSAYGMGRLLHEWNPAIVPSYIYSGEISHSQNTTMANVLELNLVSLDDEITEGHTRRESDFKNDYDIIIAVDASPNRCLPEGVECLFVVDHHKGEISNCRITDVRTIGATCSIVWQYFEEEGIHLDKNKESDQKLATAMLVGIKTDTSDLVSESVTNEDFEAYKNLLSCVDRRLLSVIVNYPISTYFFELRGELDKPENIKIDNGVFVGGAGCISEAKRDALPELATERARMEGVDTAFVFAIVREHIEVSVRSVNFSVNVHERCQKIFGKQYAGGKTGAGAAKVPMGLLSFTNISEATKDELWTSVKKLLMEKIMFVMSGN